MREGMTYGRALRLLLAGFFLGRCPACGGASMFRSPLELHARCPRCGVRHSMEDGAWLGAVAIGYGIAAVFAFVLAIIELNAHPIARFGLDPMWTIAAVSVPVTALAYRPAKGLWFTLLYLYGLGGDRDEPPRPTEA